MITRQILRCSYCKQIAREYFGLEGGTYIGRETDNTCPKSSSKSKRHNFKATKEIDPLFEKLSPAEAKRNLQWVEKDFPKDVQLPWIVKAKKKLGLT